jgi:hypothetical protein
MRPGVSAELKRRRAPPNRWRGEDEIVQLAFDFVELRDAEERVEAQGGAREGA